MKLFKFILNIVLLSVFVISCENPFDSEPSLKCKVTIEEVDNVELEVADSTKVTASVSSPNGSACNSGVKWKIDNEEVVSITEFDEYTASIKALEEGNASVTAVSVDDSVAVDELKLKAIFTPIAVYSGRISYNEDILVTNKNKHQKAIVSSDRQHLQPKWFNNGTKIAYFTYESGETVMSSIDINGKNKSDLIRLNLIAHFDITKDGKNVIMSSKENHSDPIELHHKNLETGDMTRLTFESQGGSISKGPGFPTWSPDGSKIAYQTYRDGNWEIYIMDSNGKNKVNLTNTPNTYEYKPQWSPDGSKIVFVSGPEGQGNNIEIINADGTERFSVTTGIYPSWVNDSRIIFSKNKDGGTYHIVSSDLNGDNLITIQDKGWSKVFVQWNREIEWKWKN